LISVAIHVAAYCSMNVYEGWRAQYLQSADEETDMPFLEIGLVKVPEHSVLQQDPTRETDKPDPVKVVEGNSEITVARLSRERAQAPDRKTEVDREIMNQEQPGNLSPEGSAGPSRSNAGSSTDRYLVEVRRRIAESIFYPRRARLSHLEGEVRVAFSIGADGRLAGFRVVESSPHAIFNQSARTIVEKAAPFNPPVPGIIGREIAVPIRFESTY